MNASASWVGCSAGITGIGSNLPNIPTMANGNAAPMASPITEPMSPIASDSSTTEPSTWRREAPSVRSSANSRVRCAIVIDSEFAITKDPTKSAIPANESRK